MEAKMIGSKIAKARKEMNISQAQLAQQLFISPQAVGKWERGESIPDIITFNRLAEILGVDLNYFSVSFAATTSEMVTGEPEVQGSAELPAEKKQIRSWDMSKGNWIGADFSGLKDLHDRFSSSNMQSCKFVGSEMSGLLLKSNNIDSCDFSGSDLSRSHIQNSSLTYDGFKECLLKEAEFSGSYIRCCNFSGADFTGAWLRSDSFLQNTMTNAVLNHTSFYEVHIADTVFEGIITDCSFDNCSFSRVVFQNSRLLNTFFKCRSLKHIRFVDCQADRMTYAFLKNGKANLEGLTLL